MLEEPWSWSWMWVSTNAFFKAILLLLLVMLCHSFVVSAASAWKFAAAKREAATLSRILMTSRGGDVDGALSAGSKLRSSHATRIVGAGLQAFQRARPDCPKTDAIDLAERAMQRRGALEHSELKVGLGTLATIASLAAFVGLVGTVAGLLNMFRGGSGSPTSWLVHFATSIALALVPTALGLAVGVFALMLYNHFVKRVEEFDLQSAEVLQDVLRYLRGQRDDVSFGAVTTQPSESWLVTPHSPRGWEARYDGQRVLLLSVGMVWLYVFLILGFAILGQMWELIWS